jgi:hypothetical protein
MALLLVEEGIYLLFNTSTPSLSFHLSLACLLVLSDRPVEPLSTRSRPRASFPSRFPLPRSLPLFGRLFHTRSTYLIDSGALFSHLLPARVLHQAALQLCRARTTVTRITVCSGLVKLSPGPGVQGCQGYFPCR